MERPELIFVTGCNAAGKSSLIRSHRGELPDYEVIMTDVYKSRSREVFKEAILHRKYIILETPFNVQKFAELAYGNQLLDRRELEIIAANKDFIMAERVDPGKKFSI
jgi:hypothetical protein